jgi:hypothetical protein
MMEMSALQCALGMEGVAPEQVEALFGRRRTLLLWLGSDTPTVTEAIALARLFDGFLSSFFFRPPTPRPEGFNSLDIHWPVPHCSCGRIAGYLCDGLDSTERPCDAPICYGCAIPVAWGEDRHVCPDHDDFWPRG